MNEGEQTWIAFVANMKMARSVATRAHGYIPSQRMRRGSNHSRGTTIPPTAEAQEQWILAEE